MGTIVLLGSRDLRPSVEPGLRHPDLGRVLPVAGPVLTHHSVLVPHQQHGRDGGPHMVEWDLQSWGGTPGLRWPKVVHWCEALLRNTSQFTGSSRVFYLIIV